LTTFAAMAYIIVVNPAILAAAGIPTGPSTLATILVAGLGSIAMGWYTNRPIALAPYMGENAFIAFGLAALGISWQQRLGAVFVSGVLLIVLTLAGLRGWLAKALSPSMKSAFGVGIGLFLAFIGLYESGLVASGAQGMPYEALVLPNSHLLGGPAVPVKLGDLGRSDVWLAAVGFVVMSVLVCRRVKGALLIGMGLTGAAGLLLGAAKLPTTFVALPFSGQYTLDPIAFKLEIGSILKFGMLPVFLTLFLMVFLDTLGTLVGLGAAGNMLDDKGDFPEIEKPMLVDAGATVLASLLGTSTTGAFIESATGIREGARTGLAAIITGFCFLAALFFIPAVEPLQQLKFVYAPALMVVGILMMEQMTRIRFDDWTEAVPAMATIGMMVFTYNIANGLTVGLALHPLLKLTAGRARELHPGAIVLGLVSGAYFAFGLVH
jgi:AGZA family xanthine/uracil permease-like MFS transporter